MADPTASLPSLPESVVPPFLTGGRPHAAVIGGGFAGAAAASALAEAGVTVTLIEERPTLGGRTRSFKDGVTKQDVDNGQHLLMASYHDTRAFLRRLGVEHRLRFEKHLSVPLINRRGERMDLGPRYFSGALGLLAGVLGLGRLRVRDRLSLAWGLFRARSARPAALEGMTVSRWLSLLHQTPGARRAFWDPLCLATLNETPDVAAAQSLLTVFRQGLLAGGEFRGLGYATVPLSRLWSTELGAYLKRSEGVLAPGQRATGFRVKGHRALAVEVAGADAVEADVFVLATPLPVAGSIAPPAVQPVLSLWKDHPHSPIVGINLWFRSLLPFPDPWVGLLDMDVQWFFNRERLWGPTASGQLSAVISAARAHRGRTAEELVALALADLRRAFPDFKEDPIHSSVLWEPHATPSPTPDFHRSRPGGKTDLSNFFFAGDWVNEGLPPTIEAACRSGHRAAALALAHLESLRPAQEGVTA